MDTKSVLTKPSLKILFLGVIFLLAFLWFLNYVFYNKQTGQRSRAAGETATLNYVQNGNVATFQIVPSAGFAVRGYEIRLNFQGVTVTDISYKLGVVSAGLGDDNSNLSTVNTRSSVKLQGELQSATGQVITANTPTDVATVTFSGANPSLGLTSGTFYKIETDGTLTPINAALTTVPTSTTVPTATTVPTTPPGATNTPVPTTPPGATNTPVPTVPPGSTNTPVPTDIPGGSPVPTNTPAPTVANAAQLNLKVKLQGILSKVQPDQNFLGVGIRVTVIKKTTGDLVETKDGVMFTVDDSGVWQANIPFDYTPAGDDYAILIKGPKHIQKKFCDNAPTETFPGTYRCSNNWITLTAGPNDLNFTNVLLLSGDLPEQDGIVNAYDISLVRNNVGSTDPATVGLCDINLDGKCDTQDYSLVIAALSIAADEQ